MFGSIFAAMLLGGPFSPAVPAPVADDPDKRVRFLIARLDAKLGEIESGETLILPFLDRVRELVSEPGADKNPALDVPILLNEEAFAKATQGMFDRERVLIKVRVKLKDVPLTAVLKIVCDQIEGAYVIRRNHIEIIPLDLLRAEAFIAEDDGTSFLPLVSWIGSEAPLDAALRDISRRFEANIVVASAAKEKAKAPVTANLLNVPVEAAVRSLAEMNGLKVVRIANVLIVTTKEHAKEVEDENQRQEMKRKADTPPVINPMELLGRGLPGKYFRSHPGSN
jgi:hypothetical protein